MYQAVLLDMYGTLVHEDDAVLGPICEQVAESAQVPAQVVAELWWRLFREANQASHGGNFRLQAELSRDTLAATLRHLQVADDADRLCQAQFTFWRRPPIFSDSLSFLRQVRQPICLVSNIDRDDLKAALAYHHLKIANVITSQDARAYKPRPEPFELALRTLGLTAGEVLHVGDSLTADVAGATSMGIDSAWINRSGRPLARGPSPTHTAITLTDVLPMLQAQ